MRSRVVLNIHDATVLEIAHDEWSEALQLASQIMTNIMPKSLTTRSTPHVYPIAQPKLEENRQKWGAEQWHPEQRG